MFQFLNYKLNGYLTFIGYTLTIWVGAIQSSRRGVMILFAD